jgi:hypothetical protein
VSFQIPNSTDVPQSARYGVGALARIYSSDIQIMSAIGDGVAVISGVQLVPGTTAGTVKVNAGRVVYSTGSLDIAAQDNIACVSNATTNPRWVIYELDTSGVLQANVGAAAALPIPPVVTTGRVVVGAVLIPPSATTVNATLTADDGAAKILDKRWFRIAPEVAFYQPIYTTVTDGVTYANSTTIAAASNNVNINTLTGTQSVTVASTTGFLTKGAFRVTIGASSFVISYNGTDATHFLNCSSAPAGSPSQVLLTGQTVSNAAIITSLTAAFTAANVNSYVTGSALLPVINGNTAANITAVGDAGTAGTWADITRVATGAGTAQTFKFAQVTFTYTRPAWARWLRVYMVSAGGGGGSGSRVANITTAAHGGGGGASGGTTDVTLYAPSLPSSVVVVTGMGGPGGTAVSTNANGNTGCAGSNSTIDGFGVVCSGGAAGVGGITGGAAGGLTGGGNRTGGFTSYVRASVWSAPSGAVTAGGGKGADGTAPAAATNGASTNQGPGSGGGGGGNSAASALQAAGDGGAGEQLFGIFGASTVGGAHSATVGANGPDGSGNAGDIAGAPIGGGGGAGGSGSNLANTAGGTGGKGANWGGGGGGGGNGVSTGASGAGGQGGDPCVLIVAMP